MILVISKSGLSKIPYWDGKAESFGVYVSKIEAYAKFIGMGDALDPNLVMNCPTQLECGSRCHKAQKSTVG